jgi:hypothetical protein
VSVIRPLKSTGGFPNRVLAFDTETHAVDPHVLEQRQQLTLGYTSYQDYRSGAACDSRLFATVADFWDTVESLSRPCKSARFNINDDAMLYVVAHNAGFDLMVLRAEAELESRGWSLVGIPIYPKPLYLEFEKEGRRFILMNLANLYGFIPLSKIGASLGFPKGEPKGCGECVDCKAGRMVLCFRYRPDRGCVPGSSWWRDLSSYCRRDTEIVVRAVQKWNEFCIVNECGPFRFTAAGQAMAAFRANDVADPDDEPDGAIHPPDSSSVQKLERASYHGGLTDVWRRGEFTHSPGGSFKKVDVNSMHPSQMASQLYPRKLLAYASRGSLRRLADHERVAKLSGVLAEGHGVVARCLIDTDCPGVSDSRLTALAPVSRDGKLIYPSGRFEAVLTTREAASCLRAGIIADVVELAVYELADLFSGYVARFNDLKEQYSLDGNEVFRQISKMFLNNLYGKWGQLNPVDMDLTPEMLADLTSDWPAGRHSEIYVRHDGPDITVKRFMGHVSASEGRTKEGSTSFCAIAAHIVADSRVALLEARALAGYDEALYADTDSMIVTETGFANLLAAGAIHNTALGKWKLEEEAESCELRAPKDYRFGEHHKRKGVRLGAELAGWASDRAVDGSFVDWSPLPGPGLYPVWRQTQFRSLVGALRAGDANSAVVSTVLKLAKGTYMKGSPDAETGWVYPLRI